MIAPRWLVASLAIAIGVGGCSWRSHRSESPYDLDREVFVVDCVEPFDEERYTLANVPARQYIILRPKEKHVPPSGRSCLFPCLTAATSATMSAGARLWSLRPSPMVNTSMYCAPTS